MFLLGRHAVTDPGGTCACEGTADPSAYMWALVWWPHALLNGLNPFISEAVWTPAGGNVAASALFPGASLTTAPFTAAFGPLAAYNLLSLLGPVLAAWFTFRLCRYVTGQWLPSLLGGYVFGFSSYVLGHSLGHLNLILVFLIPAGVHLALQRLDGRVSGRRFVLLMTLLITLQFLLSTEILLTALLAGGATLLLGLVFSDAGGRRRLRELVPRVLLAGGISLVLVAPSLYYAVEGLGQGPSVDWNVKAETNSADPLNYVVPTPVTWIGHDLADSVAPKFNAVGSGVGGNYSESGAYVGLPLLVIVLLYAVTHYRRTAARILLGTLALLVVASFGPHLHVASLPQPPGATYSPSIPLPWELIDQLPVIDHVIPARLSMYVFLVVALIVALWLSHGTRRRGAKLLLAGAGILLLVPNQALPYWRGKPADPAFFTTSLHQEHLQRDERVLVLPFGHNGNSMLWQAETGMYFKMVGGYLGPDVPEDYWNDPVARVLLAPGSLGPVTPERLGRPLRDFLVRRKVGAVISGAPDSWSSVIESQGLRSESLGGVLLYDVPESWRLRPSEPAHYRLTRQSGVEVVLGPSGERARVQTGATGGFVDDVTIEATAVGVSGWAATAAGSAEQVVAFADGRFVGQTPPTRARADVAGSLGPQALTSGFNLLGVAPAGTEASSVRVIGIRGPRAFELARN